MLPLGICFLAASKMVETNLFSMVLTSSLCSSSENTASVVVTNPCQFALRKFHRHLSSPLLASRVCDTEMSVGLWSLPMSSSTCMAQWGSKSAEIIVRSGRLRDLCTLWRSVGCHFEFCVMIKFVLWFRTSRYSLVLFVSGYPHNGECPLKSPAIIVLRWTLS